MATNLASHAPVTMQETISGNTEYTQNPPQAAGQTFLRGTPLQISGGYAEAWAGNPANNKIYGFSLEAGGNYSVAGEGYPANMGQQGPPWSNFNIGAPPNQPNAVVIPYGAPFITGGVLSMVANDDTVFKAQYDTSEGATTITASSVTGGVLSATAANAHFVGEQILLSGFTGDGLPLNGLTAIVLTASSTAYTATLSTNPGAIAAAGAGTDNPTYAPTAQMTGLAMGLTVDGNGSWYLDGSKTTNGTNTIAVILGLYPGDALQSNPMVGVPNGQLLFQVQPAAQQV